jgi:hypothetical protein
MKNQLKQGDDGDHHTSLQPMIEEDLRNPNLSTCRQGPPRQLPSTPAIAHCPKPENRQCATHRASTSVAMEVEEAMNCRPLRRNMLSVRSTRRTPTLGAHHAATRRTLSKPDGTPQPLPKEEPYALVGKKCSIVMEGPLCESNHTT